ncbi:hypothetical protein SAMN00777080_0974 [Aquiflexum balticum DSM 16537]|uniref:Uncharacterized protein n=1 Tax=Aquiflexum balticum DSM 16537 TaxID=758820 RepID=A0A1W2H0Z2_9BACT|nr:hypothetical protein [Aquiflexum balticum]SMD42424.1 hypothetical protein SAMN00777080_0974 [Aquiflexum balticum DSM 16537]
MAYRFYYIDDDPLENIKGIARNLSVEKDLLEVVPFQHGLWTNVLSDLLEDQSEYSGLILDWKLKNKNKDGVLADFNAAALAQQLRILSVEKKGLQKDFPIVLCSAEANFYSVYNKEKTIHDLFDIVYSKDHLSERYHEVIKELNSLARAYIQLMDESFNFEDLGYESDEFDPRFIEGIKILFNDGKIVHVIIKYLLNNIILENGLLIDENILASRLGVDLFDKDMNPSIWETLKFKILDEIRYKGILSEGWDRWYQSRLLKFWNELFGISLASLNSKERVQMLNDKFDLKLSFAKPLKYNVSSNFWYVCNYSKRPIAFEEAILVKKSDNMMPWIDQRYLSYEEAFNCDLNRDIDLVDRERVIFLKKRFSHENSRN